MDALFVRLDWPASAPTPPATPARPATVSRTRRRLARLIPIRDRGRWHAADAQPGQRATNEVVWNDLRWTPASMGGGASGGGFSIASPRPPYQDGLGLSGHARATPDVSASASNFPGWPVELGGNWAIDGGTSGAAPLIAAAMAVLSADQQRRHRPPIGPANRTLLLPRQTRAEHDLRRRERHQQLHAEGAGLPGAARLRPRQRPRRAAVRGAGGEAPEAGLLPLSERARDQQGLNASISPRGSMLA